MQLSITAWPFAFKKNSWLQEGNIWWVFYLSKLIKQLWFQKKPRLKKVKLIDSDEEEEFQAAGDSAVTEREAIANELFEGGDDAGEVLNVEHVCSTNLKSINAQMLGMFCILKGNKSDVRFIAKILWLAFFTIWFVTIHAKIKTKCSCSVDFAVTITGVGG